MAPPRNITTTEGRCKRCGAPVDWVKTVKGKNLPLDIQPSESIYKGNFVLRDGIAHYISDGERVRLIEGARYTPTEPVFTAHFATCLARQGAA